MNSRVKLNLLAIVLATSSCGVCKPKVIYKDSVRVEYRDRIIHDTATFEVTKEVEKIVTRDTMSHLENSWAKSDALVSDGFLHHSLESIPQVVKVPYEVVVTDTLVIEKIMEPEYIEKELTWWQQFRLKAFWWLILLVAIGFRKELLALIKKLFKFASI